MRNLSDTIARLSAFKSMKQRTAGAAVADRLSELGPFGSNPGALQGRIHVPRISARGLPLVVVLHGCTQTAAQYDSGSGWSRLADEAGFALLFPEQAQANNLNRCFNWFEPADIRRDQGEALSIRQMIGRMIETHGIDRDRIYITGLSAGGAMASVMLATYPELFAGGAIIAGLPYGVARSIPEAFDRMRAHGLPAGHALRRLLPDARPANGWPAISVWHGTGDQTVSLANADAIIEQWRGVHRVSAEPSERQTAGRLTRRIWRDGEGRPCLEQVLIGGMGHGTPIDGRGRAPLGAAGPFMLDVGISSTRDIAAGWGLAGRQATSAAEPFARALDPDELLVTDEMPEASSGSAASGAGAASMPGDKNAATGIRKVIEDALRQAGLM